MERVGRTVAFPGALISIIGGIFLLLGAALPAWSIYYGTRANPRGIEANVYIVGGALRPTMLLLPAMSNGTGFEIADRQVTFGQFRRVVGHISSDAARVAGPSSPTCPALLTEDTYETPILCVTPLEAAAYANTLTKIENVVRHLSGEALCCTGYRLPTVEEWSFAAAAESPLADTGASSLRTIVAGYPDATNCPGSVWFIYGMCETPDLAIADGDRPIMLGGSLGVAPAPLSSQQARIPIGFRLVRSNAASRSRFK